MSSTRFALSSNVPTARPLGAPTAFRPLVVKPHPRMDPPGARPTVDGVEILNPALVAAEPPLVMPTTKRKRRNVPAVRKPAYVGQLVLSVLRAAPDGLTAVEIKRRVFALGGGSFQRQLIGYHLTQLVARRMVRVQRGTSSGDWGSGPRVRKIYRIGSSGQ